MLGAMVPDVWVYRAAGRLIAQHGTEALNVADRDIDLARDRQDPDRMLLMLRVRYAITTLQASPSGPLH